MAKPRKLKVFRTPIGFHDAFVAAPSQKAALEAWGADSNLFAQGVAEQVTEPELMKEPLQRPGEVVKRLRGSEAEQIAALGRQEAARARTAGRSATKPKAAKAPRPPKPSRAELDRLDEKMAELERRHKAELRDIDREMEMLERRRRHLQRRHEAQHDELASERNRARAVYERAVRRWEEK